MSKPTPHPQDDSSRRLNESQWDLVDMHQRAPAKADREAALATLIEMFMPIIHKRLKAKCVGFPDISDDLTQDFVARKILLGSLFRKAKRGRGSLHGYVLTAVDNFFLDFLRRRKSDPSLQPITAGVPERTTFDDQWAQDMITLALKNMRNDCKKKKSNAIWHIFYHRIIAPIVFGDAPRPFAMLAANNQLDSEVAARNRLETGKRQFRKHLHDVVRGASGEETQLEDDMRLLQYALSHPGRRLEPSFQDDSSILESQLDASSNGESAMWLGLSSATPKDFASLLRLEGDQPSYRDELQRTLAELIEEQILIRRRFRDELRPEDRTLTVGEALLSRADLECYRLIKRVYRGRYRVHSHGASLVLYNLAIAVALVEHDEMISTQHPHKFDEMWQEMLDFEFGERELRQKLLDAHAKLTQL